MRTVGVSNAATLGGRMRPVGEDGEPNAISSFLSRINTETLTETWTNLRFGRQFGKLHGEPNAISSFLSPH
jgi:predicted Zn-dependent peptidase